MIGVQEFLTWSHQSNLRLTPQLSPLLTQFVGQIRNFYLPISDTIGTHTHTTLVNNCKHCQVPDWQVLSRQITQMATSTLSQNAQQLLSTTHLKHYTAPIAQISDSNFASRQQFHKHIDNVSITHHSLRTWSLGVHNAPSQLSTRERARSSTIIENN